MNFKKLIIFFIILFIATGAVSAANETVTNTHNDDINDPKYINPNDYYTDENGNDVQYTYDAGSFINVTMSNGYNAYGIQNSGYVETNDSKTHPSFWNETFYVVDANDTDTVVGHWHYTNREPIGDYLKILFYNHYDDLVNINKFSPDIQAHLSFNASYGISMKTVGIRPSYSMNTIRNPSSNTIMDLELTIQVMSNG